MAGFAQGEDAQDLLSPAVGTKAGASGLGDPALGFQYHRGCATLEIVPGTSPGSPSLSTLGFWQPVSAHTRGMLGSMEAGEDALGV